MTRHDANRLEHNDNVIDSAPLHCQQRGCRVQADHRVLPGPAIRLDEAFAQEAQRLVLPAVNVLLQVCRFRACKVVLVGTSDRARCDADVRMFELWENVVGV